MQNFNIALNSLIDVFTMSYKGKVLYDTIHTILIVTIIL